MSHPDLKNHNSIFQVSSSRLTTLPAALACCYLAYNMRKGVPGLEWKGKRWFPWSVRSGFGWFILSLLIVFKARPALMARQCTHIHAGRWLSAHGKALPYFPLGYHCTKVSYHCCHCRCSDMANTWPAVVKWSGGEDLNLKMMSSKWEVT